MLRTGDTHANSTPMAEEWRSARVLTAHKMELGGKGSNAWGWDARKRNIECWAAVTGGRPQLGSEETRLGTLTKRPRSTS